MVKAAEYSDIVRLRKLSQIEVDNLSEYISLLRGIVTNADSELKVASQKAELFRESGQLENHGHALEKIEELKQRHETCIRCIQECEAQLAHKQARLQELTSLLS